MYSLRKFDLFLLAESLYVNFWKDDCITQFIFEKINMAKNEQMERVFQYSLF